MPDKKAVAIEPPKEYTNSELDLWLNHIYQLFNESEIFHLAKATGTMVDGFGAKGLQKVPKPMLRKTTLEKLVKVSAPLNIIVTMYQSLFQKMKEEQDPQEMLWRLRQEGVSPAARLALIMLEKPEYFLQIRGTVEQNLESKKDPFDGLVETPELELQAKVQMTIQLEAALKQILEIEPICEKVNLPEEQSLEHVTEQLDPSQQGAYLCFAAQSEAWKQWELHHQEALWKLVMLDALRLLVQKHNEVQTLNDQLQKLQAKQEMMEISMKQQEQQIVRQKQLLAGLEEQLKLQKKVTKEMEKERNEAKNKVITAEPLEATPLLNDPRVKLILFHERYELSRWIAPSSVVVFKNVNESLKWLKSLNKKSLEKIIWFIDSDTCSSKEMFLIENILSMHKAPYRFISGNDTEFLRKMISYLEGDIHYVTA